MTVYPASARRPRDYPPGLPFVTGALVEITASAGSVAMKWFGVDRPFDVLQQLTGDSARDGWRVIDDDGPAPGGAPRRRRLRLGSSRREIVVLQAGPFSSVVLTQTGREP